VEEIERIEKVETEEGSIEVKHVVVTAYTPPASLIVIDCPPFDTTTSPFLKTNF
jgi:hypothetical protein